MKTAFARRSLFVISALALFCFSCLSSANTSSANTSLWVAESSGILKIALADEAVLFELTEAEGVEALSVDSEGGRVWAYGRGRLKAYTVKGVQEVDVAVPEMSENASVTEMLADTGGVWMAARSQLFRFDEAGQLQKAQDFSKPVTAITLDVERQQLWVAVPDQVIILADNGDEVAAFRPSYPRIHQLEYDAHLDSVWLTDGPHLFRLDAAHPDREFMAEKGTGKEFSHYLSADGQGGVWGGTRQEISHVNARGEIEFTFRPFQGRKGQNKNLQDLVADPED